MFRRNKIEVVAPRDYSNAEVMSFYGGRSVSEPKNETNVSNNLIPLLAIGTSLFGGLKSASAATGEWAVQQSPTLVPSGWIEGKTLEAIANILDPVIQVMVAFSFPIASVVLVGAGFFFMLGNSERAWDIIYKCCMGYIFIQLSPLFLEGLRMVGAAIVTS